MKREAGGVCILSDLDGTLLPPDKIPLERDKAAIRRFEAAGGRFGIATGRTVQAGGRYAEMLDIKSPCIFFNGGGLYDPVAKKLLSLRTLPPEAVKMTERIVRDNPYAGAEVLCPDATWVVNDTRYERIHIDLCGVVPEFAAPAGVRGEWMKVLFAMPEESMPEFIAYIDRQHFSGVDFMRSEKIFYEMLPAGVSKGSALDECRRLPGMEGYTFVAVGDFDNDLEMLRRADVAVCPQNAAPSVKEMADLVLTRTCAEGAMEELIERILTGGEDAWRKQ